MKRPYPFARAVFPFAIILIAAAMVIVARSGLDGSLFDDAISENSRRMMEEGRETFRHDTFGDEAFWSGSLRLHESIAGEEHGGVGPGLSPATALSLGLKVDTEALPQEVLDAIAAAEEALGTFATRDGQSTPAGAMRPKESPSTAK